MINNPGGYNIDGETRANNFRRFKDNLLNIIKTPCVNNIVF